MHASEGDSASPPLVASGIIFISIKFRLEFLAHGQNIGEFICQSFLGLCK